MSLVAIYHFTNTSKKRPGIYKKQLDVLYNYAIAQGWDVKKIYCDKSIYKHERKEFMQFLHESEQYDILLVKDYYHICKNTMECIKILQELRNKGLKIYSLENGPFKFDDIPSSKPLKVTTYISSLMQYKNKEQPIPIKQDIFRLYVKTKTDWEIIDEYIDVEQPKNNTEQHNLKELIKNKNKYDILLVDKFTDINIMTSGFFNIRNQLAMDIYSLQEGYLKCGKDSYEL